MDPKFIQLEPRAIFIQIHLGMLYFPLSEDLVQLYEKKRILISNHMTEDLRSCDAGFQDYRELYESSFNQSSEPSYQEFLPYLKYLLLLKYKKQSGNTSARIDEIISKYDLATLVNKKHQAKMNLANPDLTTEEKNNLKNEINDINHLIRGACANYQQSQKQLHQIMIAASVTIVAMAAIASLTFGIVFIPLIPLSYGIISLIISGAIGSSMVGFFGIKYRNNLQKYFDYEKEVEACSNPTIESSTLLTGTL